MEMYKPTRLKRFNFKRLGAFALLLCMALGLLPPLPIARAADSNNYHYELDTDGIDPGETYLIVSGTTNSIGSYALRIDTSKLWESHEQRITVNNNNTISAGFANESTCQWVFSGSRNGTVTSNGHYLVIDQYTHYSGTSSSMNFVNLGNGAYGIYLFGGSQTNLQYLCHNINNSGVLAWMTGYKWEANGTNSGSYDLGCVYLFKQVESAYTITYDLNQPATDHDTVKVTGTAPQNGVYQPGDAAYTVPALADGLRVDTYNKSTPLLTTTYLFTGWNTNPNGSGTSYQAGDKFTPASNVTLYAQWIQQTKYVVSAISYQDGVKSDFTDIPGCEGKSLYIKDTNSDTYLPLTRTEEGTYLAYVTANATYQVFASADGKAFEPVHEHQVVIYNADNSTEIPYYSLAYDVNGGTWPGASPTASVHYANTALTVTEEIPTRSGYTFLGWSDGSGNTYQPGDSFRLNSKTVLTAVWGEKINVTVNITVNHVGTSGGADNSNTKDDVTFQLLKEVNGVNQPCSEPVLLTDGTFNSSSHTTTYTYVFRDLEPGVYNLTSSKSGYEVTISKPSVNTINVVYNFTPTNFDLHFDVEVGDFNAVTKSLRPSAVNVKVTYWGFNSADELGWHTITQQAGSTPPTTVSIDPETGKGSGFYSVWQTWDQDSEPYYYRVEVTSFVLPDGSVVPASSSDSVNYTSDQSGLYTAEVSVAKLNGDPSLIPTYPDGSSDETALEGAYYSNSIQIGRPVATITVHPFTVTFDPGAGTLNGSNQDMVVPNQFAYPDPNSYIPAPPAGDDTLKFFGWQVNGTPAEKLVGSYLTEDVVYTANYSSGMTITGTVTAAGTYEQNGETVTIKDPDRVKEVMVVLQKGSGGIFNDVASTIVNITYSADSGTGSYTFTQVPEDGSEYRIQVRSLNYSCQYDNNADKIYTPEESLVNTGKIVDAYLSHAPASYVQEIFVDASRINKNSRPDNVTAQIWYRDLASSNPYAVISQHTVAPNGVSIDLNASGYGTGSDSVWNFHNNGALYEYQAALYNPSSQVLPYNVEYGRPAYYVNGGNIQTLQVTLIPKEYEIVFDLGNGVDPSDVQGMDDFRVDANDGERFAYIHTWSFEATFSAFPYRDGYVFKGWTSSAPTSVSVVNQGNVTVGENLAHSVTLTAGWEKLNSTDYTVRHLELNTDKVLFGAQAITGSSVNTKIKAVSCAKDIAGYEYVGAMIGGVYYDKSQNPELNISNNPETNLITIYYLPDGSDGYTDQVESNLKLNKTATLENDGTYTIQLETHTLDNPITTQILQNTPMDIVLVLDQSGSIINSGYLDDLKLAVSSFISMISNHGLEHKVEHRIAIVGYAGDRTTAPTSTNTSTHPIAGGNTSNWVNTGVFDSNGDFHPYPITGFKYTASNSKPTTTGTYYVLSNNEYLLLTYHNKYYHLITADEAYTETIAGNQVYGDVNGNYVVLERNTSGLWLYGEEQLYSQEEFFTYHEDVWTHRSGMERREIHAYGTGNSYRLVDGHNSTIYTRDGVENNPQHSIYEDALVPVSVGDSGTGGVNPGLAYASSHLGSNGGTYVQYGIMMANSIFEANPLEDGNPEGRIRIMITFTDGMPGIGTFDANVANAALEEAYKTKKDYGVFSYAIGLYPAYTQIEQTYFMNALSSNYPNAKTLNDVQYKPAADGTQLKNGGSYYVKQNNTYYQLQYNNYNNYYRGWYFNNTRISSEESPTVSSGKIGSYEIYVSAPPDETPGYYSTTSSVKDLEEYFARVVQLITTKITKEIVLHDDTIIRDIMGQGLVLTPGTVVTAYKVPGQYNNETGEINWRDDLIEQVASVTIPENPADAISSPEKAEITANGETKNVPYITVYNLQSENPTDPLGENYHPHTIDVTGYDFDQWYIDREHPDGHKMIVTITRVEARDDVVWGRATATNDAVSGLWLPADSEGNRELLLPFERPTTLFVERTYVLDYGKSFTLGNWYFDAPAAGAIHVDCIIDDGMNWFNETAPNKANSTAEGAPYGNTKYGNVTVQDGQLVYTPVNTNWNGYDQFYVFGNTDRSTVVTQDANTNGNLWSKVTVIPANNVYFEDSFLSMENAGVNNMTGFTFSEGWEVVVEGDAHNNKEHAETQETSPNNVHGWTDDLADDLKFTDGSAHSTAEMGASASFTFTGTGVDVYTRTNEQSGLIVAVLSKMVDGKEVSVDGQVIDNLAVSGDYYHVPTVSFKKLPYGTYTVNLIATAASDVVTGNERYQYYLDGIRVYSPLGGDQRAADSVVKEAYGLELNAVFTEVRDILLHYEDFNTDIKDDSNGIMGAVFIDWIRDGQGSGDDKVGNGVSSYEIGTYTELGPKNEVYLSAGQAIVIKVDPEQDNNYYIGLKSLAGTGVVANVSGTTLADAKPIIISHTTDQYYKVDPLDGYIVIKNDPDSTDILSVTKLRTTNLEAPVPNGGIVSIDGSAAPDTVSNVSDLVPLIELAAETNTPDAETPQSQNAELFASIQRWLETE